MTFGERLMCLRKEKGFTRESFANYLEMSKFTLRNYEMGTSEPNSGLLKRLSEIFNVSIDYLLCVTDEKEKVSSYNLKQSEYEHIEKYRFISQNSQAGKETVDYVLNKQYEIAEQIKLTNERITKLESKPAAIIEFLSDSETPSRILQYFHSVSAGTGQVIFDDVYSERVAIPDIPEYGRVSYAVKVSGHSMEPLYNDGDMLLIEPTCEVELGEVGIFIVGNEAFVKKLGGGELISLNKGYDNIPLTTDSKCMGRVVDKYIVE